MLNKFNNINALSMVAEKAFQTLLNFAVLTVIARFLGPEKFGTFGLLQAVFIVGFHVALFFSEQIIMKFLIIDGSNTRTLYRKIMILKYMASLPIYFTSIGLSKYFYGDGFAILAAIYCCTHLVNVDKLYFSYFRALEKGFLVFVARMSVYIPLAIMKIVIVVYYGDLLLVAMIYVFEAALLGILSYYLYRKDSRSHVSNLEVAFTDVESPESKEGAKVKIVPGYGELTKAAWPIFSSALLITLYSRIDQFMIESMLGAKDLGIYTAAVKISEASTYLVTTLIASRFPQLMRLNGLDSKKFDQEIMFLLKVAFIFSIGSFVIFAFGAEYIIRLLFGVEYVSASEPLVIHMAGTIFICYGVICTQYLIAKNLEIYRLYRVFWGLVINIVLNVFLIPRFGLLGAAASTFFSQALSSVMFNACSPKTRGIFRLQIQSFAFWRFDLRGKQ